MIFFQKCRAHLLLIIMATPDPLILVFFFPAQKILYESLNFQCIANRPSYVERFVSESVNMSTCSFWINSNNVVSLCRLTFSPLILCVPTLRNKNKLSTQASSLSQKDLLCCKRNVFTSV